MDIQKKYRLAIAGFMAMVMLNIGVLGWLWVMHPHGRQHDFDKPGSRIQHIINNQLHLTEKQRRAFKKMRNEYRKGIRSAAIDLQNYRGNLYKSINATDSNRIDSLTQLMAEAQKKIIMMNRHHFKELRSVLNDSQRVVFDKMLNRISDFNSLREAPGSSSK